MSDSGDQHQKRMARGVNAVSQYLHAQFPDHIVESLEPSSRDFDRDTRTFKVRRNDKEKYLLRVTDEVLDWDAAGVSAHLERLRVAQTLRAAGAGNAILVTTDGTSRESI